MLTSVKTVVVVKIILKHDGPVVLTKWPMEINAKAVLADLHEQLNRSLDQFAEANELPRKALIASMKLDILI